MGWALRVEGARRGVRVGGTAGHMQLQGLLGQNPPSSHKPGTHVCGSMAESSTVAETCVMPALDGAVSERWVPGAGEVHPQI